MASTCLCWIVKLERNGHEATQDWQAENASLLSEVARNRRVLPQRKVGTTLVVIFLARVEQLLPRRAVTTAICDGARRCAQWALRSHHISPAWRASVTSTEGIFVQSTGTHRQTFAGPSDIPLIFHVLAWLVHRHLNARRAVINRCRMRGVLLGQRLVLERHADDPGAGPDEEQKTDPGQHYEIIRGALM
jgi:hypothetical protein